ncbi:MAG: hypothetical protein ACXADL_08505 [Candidatus Thorarchaeota archaeon]|jgi:hypothetical protein
MTAKKWILSDGRVYKLAEGTLRLNDAIRLASRICSENHVVLKKAESNLWAVYWRHKKGAVWCPVINSELTEFHFLQDAEVKSESKIPENMN